MYDKALAYRDAHITRVDEWAEFERMLDEKTGFFSRALGWNRCAGGDHQGKDQSDDPLHPVG